jgi:hypothetical protein
MADNWCDICHKLHGREPHIWQNPLLAYAMMLQYAREGGHKDWEPVRR